MRPLMVPALLLLAAGPAAAQGLAERPSRWDLASLPATAWQAASLPATRWQAATLPATRFVLRPAGSSLAGAPAGSSTVSVPVASEFRLREVETRLRPRTQQLLSAFGAERDGDAIRIALPGDVLFDFDRSEIRADARPVLARLVELLRGYPRAPVDIQGHTDARGDDAYNQALSDRRALSVRAHLVAQGLPAARLHPQGFGETRPVAPNAQADGSDDAAGRQRNRRVEFIIRPAPSR